MLARAGMLAGGPRGAREDVLEPPRPGAESRQGLQVLTPADTLLGSPVRWPQGGFGGLKTECR